MKILTSLLGLILFIAGIYLTYWVFLDFDSYETLILGLYLGGSFILMTLGFFLFLLPLSFKSKNKEITNQNEWTTPNPTPSLNQETETISEVDAIKIIRDESETSQTEDSEEFKSFDLNSSNKTDSNPQIKQSTINLNTGIHFEKKNELTEELKFKTDEFYDIVELRVIGIDSWSSQNILKKLNENSLLEISQKLKSGINMTQVLYHKKLIGYISRLDMNKVNDRLNNIVSITPSNIIKEGHKIVHFSVNLKLKQKDNENEQRNL